MINNIYTIDAHCHIYPEKIAQRAVAGTDKFYGENSVGLGTIEDLLITNKQFVFERKTDDERIIVMINADSEEYVAHFNANAGCGLDIITGKHFDFGGGSFMPPYSVQYIKTE